MNKEKKINDFNKAAMTYEKNAVVQNRIIDDLVDQLSFIKIDPKYILDIGSGTGRCSKIIQKKYPNAIIVNLDFSLEMLREGNVKKNILQKIFDHKKIYQVCCDFDQLPFSENSFDLVISTSSFQWSENLQKLFAMINIILKDGGLLIFSAFIEGTFKELSGFNKNIVNKLNTAEDYVYFLQRNNFRDPVLLSDEYSIDYQSSLDLLKDIKKLGITKSDRSKESLYGKSYLNDLLKHLDLYKVNNKNRLSYSAVFGHAWKLNTNALGVEEKQIKFI